MTPGNAQTPAVLFELYPNYNYDGFTPWYMINTIIKPEIRTEEYKALFEGRKQFLADLTAFENRVWGDGSFELTVKDSYYNMRQKIEPCMYGVERAKRAMEKVGMEPLEVPIRGGMDGARLSYMGLPCPNLCTGGENYHGRFEYIPVEDMEKCVDMLIAILIGL